jgi:hypothetical protein
MSPIVKGEQMNQQGFAQQHSQFGGGGAYGGQGGQQYGSSPYGGGYGSHYGLNAQAGQGSQFGSGMQGGNGWGQGGFGGQAQVGQRSDVSFNPYTMDKDYNLISVLYHALQAVDAISKYCEDARREGSQEIAAFLEQAQQQNLQLAQRAKELLFRQRQI